MKVQDIDEVHPPEINGHNPEVPLGMETRMPRKRGRPPRGEEKKPFISELPAPNRYEFAKPDEFFSYLRKIPLEKRKRITLNFYRYHPVCDMTAGGTKTKSIDVIMGEAEPFPFANDDWELAILHLYGSGNYGCYLNEMNRTICRCLKISTKWDLENYPPIVDPATLDQNHPNNKAYIQWLRQKGITLPSEQDKQQEESDMLAGEAMKTMADTVNQLAMRSMVPTPPQQSMGEKLTFEAAKSAIDIVADQAKSTNNARTQESNPLELVNALVSVADKMRGNTNGNDDAMKTMLHETMQTNRMLMEKMFTRDVTPPKSGIDSLKETVGLFKDLKEVFGSTAPNKTDDEDKPGKESVGEMLVRSLPTVAPVILQLVDRGMTAWTMLRQPVPVVATQPPTQQMQPPQSVNQMTPAQMQEAAQRQAVNPNVPVNGSSSGESSQMTQPPPQTQQVPINPATSQPYTPEELQAWQEAQQRYRQYHGFIASIMNPLLNHLNDTNPNTEERKNGYDFADWFISGNGRVMYDTIKTVGVDTLMGAFQSYPPLWGQIGGIEVKVRQFVEEFMTYDEMLANQESEGEETDE